MIHNRAKFENPLIATISISILLVLVISSVSNLVSLKHLRNQQIMFGVQAVSNEVNNYISNVESKIYSFVEWSSATGKTIRDVDDQGFVLLDENSTNVKPIVARKIDNELPINILLPLNNELWIQSQIKIGNTTYAYAYRLKNLQEYIGNVSSNLIVIHTDGSHFPSNCEHEDNTGQNLGQFCIKRGVHVDGKNLAFDFIPALELIDHSNKTIGYCFLGVDITPIQYTARVAYLQCGISVVLILLLFALIRRKRARSKNLKEIDNQNINRIVDYQQIINSSAEGVRIIDLDYRIAVVNHAFTKITGITSDQALNKKCYECYKSVVCHTGECPLELITQGERLVENIEVRLKNDGSRQECFFNTSPLFDKNGDLVGIIERFREVTNNIELEEKLKRSEHFFEDFMDNLPIGVYIEDGITHKIQYQNTYIKQITGGKTLNTYADLPSFNAYGEEKQIQITDALKQQRYFRSNRFKFLNVDRKLQVGGLLVDISKRKEVEDICDLLIKAIEILPVSIVILDKNGRVEFANPLFANLTDYSIDEIKDKDFLSLNLEAKAGSNFIQNALEKAHKEGIWRGEFKIGRGKGMQTWVYASFMPIYNHLVAVMEDITVRKEHEKEIVIAKRQAEDSDKLKSSFLSNISHEIRTPLNAIIGFASLLSDNDLSSSERNNLSEIIYRNSNGLLNLIENIIEISEIESDQISISKQEFNLNALLTEVYQETINEEQKNTNVKLSLKKPPEEISILSDSQRLKQVLKHLLSNACKFTEQGFIELGYTQKDAETLLFYVVDSGVGIEPDKQAVVFNPFRQADESSTRRFGGMGLGLAISKHIVEKLGGKIWINSTLGSGTSVYFTVSCIKITKNSEDNDILSSYQWGNRTILVADDIDANFTYFKSILKKTNAQLLWARNGNEAVNIVKNSPDIDLILMDLIMPVMDGFEATRTIKSFNTEIPIIAQTAYSTSQNLLTVAQCGFDSMLEKPIKVNKMLSEISKFMKN